MSEDDTSRSGGGRFDGPDQPEDQAPQQMDDFAFDRLRGADPARAMDLDLDAIRHEVHRRTTDRRQAVGPMRWLRVAAVAATVAAVGIGGFVIGDRTRASVVDTATSAPGTVGSASATGRVSVGPTTGGPAPAMAEGGKAVATAPTPTGIAGSKTGAPATGAGVAGDAKMGYYGRNHFSAGGLSTAGGSAEAWTFDPTGVVSQQRAESLAAQLGVTGTAVAQYGSWVVGPNDGSGPMVSLSGDGLASFSYSDPAKWNIPTCGEVGIAIDGGGAEAPSPDGTSVAPCEAQPSVPAIGTADAVQRSKEILTSVGADVSQYQFEANGENEKGPYTWVTAYSLVNGVRTGQTWWFSFVGTDLAGVNGQLAPVVSLGQYEVISPAAAVQRLNDLRFGGFGGAIAYDTMPMPTSEGPSTPPNEVVLPPVPAAGAPLSWPVNEVTITSAKLDLAMQWQTDGSVIVAPSYTLNAADGSSWSVIAISDAGLDFSSR